MPFLSRIWNSPLVINLVKFDQKRQKQILVRFDQAVNRTLAGIWFWLSSIFLCRAFLFRELLKKLHYSIIVVILSINYVIDTAQFFLN